MYEQFHKNLVINKKMFDFLDLNNKCWYNFLLIKKLLNAYRKQIINNKYSRTLSQKPIAMAQKNRMLHANYLNSNKFISIFQKVNQRGAYSVFKNIGCTN